MRDLWSSTDHATWRDALAAYEDVVAAQGVAALADLDRWYRTELPGLIVARDPAHVTLPEMIRVTEWKMARGVWRAPNLVLVRGNPPSDVERWSFQAIAAAPHPKAPLLTLAQLAGVGPATASAVVAAARPDVYPFFDELVAAPAAGLGPVKWTIGYYIKYSDALRARARSLGKGWTPVDVERALWSFVGGKTGAAH